MINKVEISGVNTVSNLLEEEIDKVKALELRIDGKLEDVNTAIEEVNNMDLEANKVGKVTTISLTKKDGTEKSVTIEDGMGLQYNWNNTSLGVKREDEENYQYVDLRGEKGEKGDCNFATFKVNSNMELVMNKTEDMLLDFSLSEDGILSVII